MNSFKELTNSSCTTGDFANFSKDFSKTLFVNNINLDQVSVLDIDKCRDSMDNLLDYFDTMVDTWNDTSSK
jgi:hypothetical protein